MNRVRVSNKLTSWIGLGVFCNRAGVNYRYGVVQSVPAGGSVAISVPDGIFYVYWIHQDMPAVRFRNPRTTVLRGGRELTLTIGASGGDPPMEESF